MIEDLTQNELKILTGERSGSLPKVAEIILKSDKEILEEMNVNKIMCDDLAKHIVNRMKQRNL